MSSAPLASAPYKQTTQPPATIAEVPSAEPSENVIIVFEDNVSKEEIDEHVAKLISAGGKIKYAWYLEKDNIMGNAFAATVPMSCLSMFQGLQAGGKIKHIESDGIVTIQPDVESTTEVQPELAPTAQQVA